MIFEVAFRAREDRFVPAEACVRVCLHPDSPAVVSPFPVGAGALGFVTYGGFAGLDAAVKLGYVVHNTLMSVLCLLAREDRVVPAEACVRICLHPDSPAVIASTPVGASTLAFVAR